jgi:hypothetical protein
VRTITITPWKLVRTVTITQRMLVRTIPIIILHVVQCNGYSSHKIPCCTM